MFLTFGNMRKLLGLGMLIVLSFCQDISYGQNLSRGFFNREDKFFIGGLSLGANFSTVDGDNYGGYHKAGWNTGGIVYVKPLKKMMVSIEILYTQKGSRGVKVYESSYTGTAIEHYAIDLNYVELPFNIHYVLSDKWNIGIGASYAQLIKSKESIFTDQPIIIDPSKSQFRKQDYNIIFSGTWQIGDGLFLVGKYQYSLNTIRDAANIPQGLGGPVQYNNLFSLKLMYLVK